MKIVSTNIANSKTVSWRGRDIKTGIYKKPIDQPIYLGKEDVTGDAVIDRKHHGGEFKACYLFGADYYPDWKSKFPHLNWDWGMFGENLTVEGLDESELHIGAIYTLGTATIQITEPRQPCHKLGIKFGTQLVIKEFIEYGHPGTYVRILEEGEVTKGDTLTLVKENKNAITCKEYNELVNAKKKDTQLLKMAISNDSIQQEKREKLKKLL
jgi:MOSC domain-containing protein YiiM